MFHENIHPSTLVVSAMARHESALRSSHQISISLWIKLPVFRKGVFSAHILVHRPSKWGRSFWPSYNLQDIMGIPQRRPRAWARKQFSTFSILFWSPQRAKTRRPSCFPLPLIPHDWWPSMRPKYAVVQEVGRPWLTFYPHSWPFVFWQDARHGMTVNPGQSVYWLSEMSESGAKGKYQ